MSSPFSLEYFDPPQELSRHILTLFRFAIDEGGDRADRHPGGLGQLVLLPRGEGAMQFGERTDEAPPGAYLFCGFSAAAPFHVTVPWHAIGASLSPLGWAALTGEPASKHLDSFPPASTRIQTAMPALLAFVREHAVLRERLFQVNYLSTTTGELAVTLIYHKPLDDTWQSLAQALQVHLKCNALIGRSRKSKRIVQSDCVEEVQCVAGRHYRYRQMEGSFSQPNAHISTAMLNWAHTHIGSGQQLLELYCGSGNFTLPLAAHYHWVLATEIAKSSIDMARHNCRVNAIDNIEFVRMSSEDFAAALRRERSYNRLQGIDLDRCRFDSVLVDPPRSGLDGATLEIIKGIPRALYISCNPQTLLRDLVELETTHSVERLALFDQFPYTAHREMGVVLNRRV